MRTLLTFFLVTYSFAHAETTFRMRLIADPQTLDWNLAHTSMETPIVMNIMEGLVESDRKMKIRPKLAKSWTISKDRKTYTFKLRNDVKWSDGKSMQAADFIYSFKRLLDPLTAAPYAYMLFDVEGAEEFNTRKSNDFDSVGVKALDPYTIQIKLKKPVGYFLQILTFWITFPVREDVVAKHGVNWPRPGNVVVLGPYIPVSYQPQAQITLKRNEKYYGPPPQVDTVVMPIINEDSTALNLFKTGQLDFVRPINFLEVKEFSDKPSFHVDPYYRNCYININTKKYPFNLPKVRKALAMSIDKSKLMKVMHHSIQHTDTLVPESLFPAGKNIGISFNPVEAKNKLKEVGIDPTTLSGIELFTYASDENTLLAQYLQDQVKKNMGLALRLQAPEFKMFRTQLELMTGALYHRCWGADYADPDSFLSVFLSTSGNSRTGWQNEKYDALVKKAASLNEGAERTRLYKEALQILLVDEAVIVPLYFDSLVYLLNPKVKNFVINPLNYVYFRDIVFTK
ncbi:MAG: peptide ABC transporter substrate-binding protein [Bdellovibrionota bacterium]